MAGGSSEPFQGSWAYLGPHGITPGVVAQFLGAWETRKKEGVFFTDFVFYQLLHSKFLRAESGKSFVSTASHLGKMHL